MRCAVVLLAVASCGEPGGGSHTVVRLGEIQGRADLIVELDATIEIDLDGSARIVEIEVAGGTPSLEGEPAEGGSWFRPRPVAAERLTLTIQGSGSASVTIFDRGPPVPAARRERSLVWTDPLVVEDPAIVGLGRVLAAAGTDGHGGVLLDRWLRRFATTAHSERAAPAQLADEIAAAQGSDPTAWNLDALPFLVTAAHNRIDLAARNGGCGELRVSFASTHPVYAPFHVIFLFRQEPGESDVSSQGVHCLGTARRWARLATLDGAPFAAEADALLGEALVHDRFLLAETVELTISPWEWRQWAPQAADRDTLDNPPLFQTVATESLNAAGPLRNDFLQWVAGNAAALDAREIQLPATFRSPSARVNPGVARTPLDLTGLDPAVAASYPALAERIEIVGCPACHTTNAEFVQTDAQRRFSPFYDLELDARAVRLDLMNAGAAVSTPPFGPLQAAP